jgi:hypothetical protein
VIGAIELFLWLAQGTDSLSSVDGLACILGVGRVAKRRVAQRRKANPRALIARLSVEFTVQGIAPLDHHSTSLKVSAAILNLFVMNSQTLPRVDQLHFLSLSSLGGTHSPAHSAIQVRTAERVLEGLGGDRMIPWNGSFWKQYNEMSKTVISEMRNTAINEARKLE